MCRLIKHLHNLTDRDDELNRESIPEKVTIIGLYACFMERRINETSGSEIPRPYGHGFLNQGGALQHRLSAGVSSGDSRPPQNGDCRIVVAGQDEAAERTCVNPIRKRFLDSLSACAAQDARMMSRNLLHPATSIFSFVCKEVEKLAPSGISNTFG